MPTTCTRCGNKLDGPKTTGRPRVYCSAACRKAAHEDRRPHREGAVKVQIVEKTITEIREREVEVPHPKPACLSTILASDDSLCRAVDALADIIR
jgi:hypothetical protein